MLRTANENIAGLRRICERSDQSKLERLLENNDASQKPIARNVHLPYKQSTVSDEKLFIEIVFAEN